MRQANFNSSPSNSPGKARVVFELYLGVRSQLKTTDYRRADRELPICESLRVVSGPRVHDFSPWFWWKMFYIIRHNVNCDGYVWYFGLIFFLVSLFRACFFPLSIFSGKWRNILADWNMVKPDRQRQIYFVCVLFVCSLICNIHSGFWITLTR